MEEIIGPLARAHELINAAVENRFAFDAASSTRKFRISGTDIEQTLTLPLIVKLLEAERALDHSRIQRGFRRNATAARIRRS